MTKPVELRTPSERFRKLFTTLEKTAEVVGANIMRENYRLNFLTYILIIFIIGFFSCTIYTCYVGVAVEENWLLTLEAICMSATAIQGTAKLTSAIINAPRLRFLRSEIDSMYKKYETERAEYRQDLERSLLLFTRSTIIFAVIYGLAILGHILVPLYYSYVRKENTILILQFLIPGLDPKTSFGYTVHQIVHVISLIFGFFGNFASDILAFILIIHIPLMKNILKCKFDDLDDVLRQHPRDPTKSGALLKDIFQWHQKYMDFSGLSKDSFFWVIFVQVASGTLCMILTIICQFLDAFKSGPVYLLYLFLMLYMYSGLGNLVDISNDDVTICIYDSLWYLLTVPEQKMILIMLRESQVAEGMSIGGVSPLSLNAALQITKSIYTVTMLINEFLN